MSADLFAEFGAPEKQQQKPPPSTSQGAKPAPTFSFFDDLATTSAPAPAAPVQPQPFQWGQPPASTSQDNDDWGDFEGASSFETAPPKPIPAFQSQLQASPGQTAPIPALAPKPKKPADPNVLFDAEDDNEDEDEDDFGDFEDAGSAPTATPAPPTASRSTGLEDLLNDTRISKPTVTATAPSSLASQDLLGLDAFAEAKPSPKPRPAAGFGSTVQAKHAPKAPKSATPQHDDSWGTFDDWEASIPTPAPAKKASVAEGIQASHVTMKPQALVSPTFGELEPGEQPPTNVPPPGVLLSLFPPLFGEAHNRLFKPMSSQTLPMRNKLLSESATITYLQGYLMLASVAARIIAGRKLRWKRDKHLSQGMRIGPASSRATSGMKLTGVDKGEVMKEDREVSDVVRVWKDQLGRLRHVVSAANQVKAGTLGSIPEMQETLPVKTLKQAEGGVPAPHPCMLCGLKRDERMTTVEQSVDDSFGEYWIDQVMMHRACRNFWAEHKEALRQR